MVGAACWFIWSGVNLGGNSRPRALKFVIQRIRSTTVKRDGAAGTLRPTGDQLLQLSYSDHRGRYGSVNIMTRTESVFAPVRERVIQGLIADASASGNYAGIEKSPVNVLHHTLVQRARAHQSMWFPRTSGCLLIVPRLSSRSTRSANSLQ